MTEFGSLALVDDGAGDGEGVNISLPGVRKGTTRLYSHAYLLIITTSYVCCMNILLSFFGLIKVI